MKNTVVDDILPTLIEFRKLTRFIPAYCCRPTYIFMVSIHGNNT